MPSSPRLRPQTLAAVLLLAAPAPAFAFGGIGCPDLPEYYRAIGAIENGPSSCDMSLEEAHRIIAEHDGTAAAPPPAHLRRRLHHRRAAHRLATRPVESRD